MTKSKITVFWILLWVLCHVETRAQGGICDYRVIREYSHDESIFTQGLYWEPGRILESSGIYGRSKLIENQWPDGTLIRDRKLKGHQFAEGITVNDGVIYQLTWKEGELIVYRASDLSFLHTIAYRGQGWGLTHSKDYLIRSDGSHCLYYHSFGSFSLVKKRCISDRAIKMNAMAYQNGVIYANDFLSNHLIRIRELDFRVLDILDLGMLRSGRSPGVANGVTIYKPDQIIVTGKNWDKLYLLDVSSCAKAQGRASAAT